MTATWGLITLFSLPLCALKMVCNKRLKIVFLTKTLDDKFRGLVYDIVFTVNNTVLCTLKLLETVELMLNVLTPPKKTHNPKATKEGA